MYGAGPAADAPLGFKSGSCSRAVRVRGRVTVLDSQLCSSCHANHYLGLDGVCAPCPRGTTAKPHNTANACELVVDDSEKQMLLM